MNTEDYEEKILQIAKDTQYIRGNVEGILRTQGDFRDRIKTLEKRQTINDALSALGAVALGWLGIAK